MLVTFICIVLIIFFQITVKYGSNYRSRIINSEVQKSVCKAILNNRNPDTCIKSLTKDDQFKSALLDCLCKEIRKEVCNRCRKDETLLKYDNNIKWKQIEDELIFRAPSIVRIFQSIVSKDIKSSSSTQYINNLCTAFSVLLYGRNHQLSQIQHVIGFVLDQCGATKEVQDKLTFYLVFLCFFCKSDKFKCSKYYYIRRIGIFKKKGEVQSASQ